MPTTHQLPVKQLFLDVRNFRTVPQPDETAAIHALMAIDTDWFWALMDSLLDTGYLPTENIIILQSGKKQRVGWADKPSSPAAFTYTFA